MFPCSAMSTIAKLWKEPRCPSEDEWIKKIQVMHYAIFMTSVAAIDHYLLKYFIDSTYNSIHVEANGEYLSFLMAEEPSCTVGGNVNWCCHSGKLCGGSSKTCIFASSAKHSVEHALRKSNHLRDLFQKPEVSTVKFLFLVGGFAGAPLLQQLIQAAFGGKRRIIIPQDVGLTVLKGAVLFGLDPVVIKVRRSSLTYRVGVLNSYVEGKHPPEKLLVKDGTRWCTGVFDKFISADQSVALEELVKRSYTPANPSQLVIIINIYSSDDVSFITDLGVKKCGTLCLDLTGTSGTAVLTWREIQTLMQFGDTEIKVIAIDIATAKSVKVGIDFLNY
ncbi:unnamed protein product [Nyctereutes procyonoides]|uniref:(raccoon dog) hypothetical protein n=1 Tax=Nyctereutes procyonoides TaxID=34880 RepID=A0A811YWZ8_NYCPR|nr:unnamed protein product [Nyctereutes procyonoides]